MPNQHPVSAEQIQQVLDLFAKGMCKADIAREVGIHRDTVRKTLAGGSKATEAKVEPTPKHTQSEEVSGDSWNISLPSTRIHTLEQLVEHCKIDLQIWEVERFVCNKWEVGAKVGEKLVAEPLFQVKAWLKKKVAVAFARQEIELLRKEALKYSPKFTGFKPRKPAGSGVAIEYSVYDHHFGALIWGQETGGEDWDNNIALKTWKDAFESLASKTRGFNAEMAVLVLGNDQQNSDNRQGATENLTPQSMDSRYHKVYSISKEASRWAVEKLLGEYGRVHVIMVPGNHDPLATWHLGDYLTTLFRLCPGVTIDNSVPMRKWWEYGVVMLMFEHGHKGKLPNYGMVMAAEKPEMWGRTKWREAHTGDKHHKTTIEDMGATIRSLSSLRPACAWSTENHHTGSIRAAEAFAWSKTEGLIGQATYSILRKGEQ